MKSNYFLPVFFFAGAFLAVAFLAVAFFAVFFFVAFFVAIPAPPKGVYDLLPTSQNGRHFLYRSFNKTS